MPSEFDLYCAAKALMEMGFTLPAISAGTGIPINSLRHMKYSKTHKNVYRERNHMGELAFRHHYLSNEILAKTQKYEDEHAMNPMARKAQEEARRKETIRRILHRKD